MRTEAFDMSCGPIADMREEWILSGEWDTLNSFDYKSFRITSPVLTCPREPSWTQTLCAFAPDIILSGKRRVAKVEDPRAAQDLGSMCTLPLTMARRKA